MGDSKVELPENVWDMHLYLIEQDASKKHFVLVMRVPSSQIAKEVMSEFAGYDIEEKTNDEGHLGVVRIFPLSSDRDDVHDAEVDFFDIIQDSIRKHQFSSIQL